MRKIVFTLFLLSFISCSNTKHTNDNVVVENADSLVEDMNRDSVADASLQWEGPTDADDLFDDFIFNYASDSNMQKRRTIFPLNVTCDGQEKRVERQDWKYDSLFVGKGYYTAMFDSEDEMNNMEDSNLNSVNIEWVNLPEMKEKVYYFKKNNRIWKLEHIDCSNLSKDSLDNFLDFYQKFVTDSVFQEQHVRNPMQFVTIDPDDNFSILETTIDYTQWKNFTPHLPTEDLINMDYGQKLDRKSSVRILKVAGVGNESTTIYYFKKIDGKWMLYKYEDTSV